MKDNKLDFSCFIIILGGSFQGKSLLSLRIAEKYKFSGVLSTDYIRNILRIQRVNDIELLCSTSKLTEKIFNKQREIISTLLMEILETYAIREEKLVIEGIHLSKEVVETAINNGAKCILLDNQLDWSSRTKLKKITRNVTRIFNTKTGQELYTKDNLNNKNFKCSYIRDEKKFKKIHEIIVKDFLSKDIKIIKFKSLSGASSKIYDYLDLFYKL